MQNKNPINILDEICMDKHIKLESLLDFLRIEEKDFYITDEVALKLALYLGEGSKLWRDAQLKWDEEFNQ